MTGLFMYGFRFWPMISVVSVHSAFNQSVTPQHFCLGSECSSSTFGLGSEFSI